MPLERKRVTSLETSTSKSLLSRRAASSPLLGPRARVLPRSQRTTPPPRRPCGRLPSHKKSGLLGKGGLPHLLLLGRKRPRASKCLSCLLLFSCLLMCFSENLLRQRRARVSKPLGCPSRSPSLFLVACLAASCQCSLLTLYLIIYLPYLLSDPSKQVARRTGGAPSMKAKAPE